MFTDEQMDQLAEAATGACPMDEESRWHFDQHLVEAAIAMSAKAARPSKRKDTYSKAAAIIGDIAKKVSLAGAETEGQEFLWTMRAVELLGKAQVILTKSASHIQVDRGRQQGDGPRVGLRALAIWHLAQAWKFRFPPVERETAIAAATKQFTAFVEMAFRFAGHGFNSSEAAQKFVQRSLADIRPVDEDAGQESPS